MPSEPIKAIADLVGGDAGIGQPFDIGEGIHQAMTAMRSGCRQDAQGQRQLLRRHDGFRGIGGLKGALVAAVSLVTDTTSSAN